MSAAARPAPVTPKCDDPSCDDTRHIELPDGAVVRCPRCHPLTPRSLTALIEERGRLQRELKRVDDAIAEAMAAAEAPSWQRGPVRA